MKMYLIRSPLRKSFSSGGTGSHFWSGAKAWNSLPSLKNHLNLGFHVKYGDENYTTLSFTEYLDCELITIDCEDLSMSIDKDFLKDYYRKKAIQLEIEKPNYPLDTQTKKILDL